MFAVVVYYGGNLVKSGELTVGSIISFLLYMLQMIMLVRVIVQVFNQIFKVIGASRKLTEILTYVPLVKYVNGKTIPDNELKGVIEFRNISFEYPKKLEKPDPKKEEEEKKASAGEGQGGGDGGFGFGGGGRGRGGGGRGGRGGKGRGGGGRGRGGRD